MDAGDRLELHELAARYGDLIDARDWDALAGIFVPDAVFDLSDIGAGRLEGLDAIVAHLDGARHPVAHHITNVHVDPGPPVVLSSRVLGLLDDGRVGSGTYRDVVERRPEGWRIVRRDFLLARDPRRADR